MLGRTIIDSSACSAKTAGLQVSQVRYRRTLAYPFYSKAGNIPPARKGRKQTVFKRLMDQFLGPKNYKGEYYLNKYAYVKTNHTTNYINPRNERGNALLESLSEFDVGEEDDSSSFRRNRSENALQPFPLNSKCVTNLQISNETKARIVDDILLNKIPSQQVALKYGLKIQRIEAILKLREIEEEWEQNGLIKGDLKRFSNTLYNMFPLYNPEKHAENLTEIPIPKETLQSRFLTIAESEPFGPVDAAKEFNLEPAAVTLERLSEGGEHSSHHSNAKANKDGSFISTMYKGDKYAFKFTPVKVGNVGYRYGKVFRDNRKDRKIAYDAAGNKYYPIE
ncbi:hypothetical protein C6P40_000031 [Pichia californica]|uniref:37S ribosomal protein S35, mitochondrial n=1 Tax=Pichia californica TaxID=460514 RepID=A0A9P7BIC4_9ASCO|nr:hypothetical protein C6P40_000031 [[Candida] californica]